MADLTHVPTFTGDAFCGIYLGYREETKTRQDTGEKYTQYVLGMKTEIPTKFGTMQEMVTELIVSKALQDKGFLTLMGDMVDTEVALPVFITAYGKSVSRYVTESAIKMFGQGAKVIKENAV